MFVAERFLSLGIDQDYGKDPVSTNGGMWHPSQTCNKFMKLIHHAQSPNEKSIIERNIQNVKEQN